MKKFFFTVVLCLTLGAQGQSGANSPMHDQRSDAGDEHATAVDMRGDHAMGFSHEATVHHFFLLPDGGIIAVDIRAAHDDQTRNQIRAHLSHIAVMFASNDFNVPMFIHDKVPPGVPILKEKHDSIVYTYEPTKRGGQVRITTHDPDALNAVHDFLVFQIRDHRTGDPVTLRQHP